MKLESQDLVLRSFLRNDFSARKARNPRYSIRAYAKALGLSGGALNQILSGKRIPSYRGAPRDRSAP